MSWKEWLVQRANQTVLKTSVPSDTVALSGRIYALPMSLPRKFKRHLCAQWLRLSTVSFYSFVFLSDTGNFVTATAYCGEFNDH